MEKGKEFCILISLRIRYPSEDKIILKNTYKGVVFKLINAGENILNCKVL